MPEPRFSPDDLRTLQVLLDTLVPPRPDGRLPGAGALLGAEIAALLESSGVTPQVATGLRALEARAQQGGAAGFGALETAERETLLRSFDRDDPGFLPGLLFHTYSRYYQQAPVLRALGLEARPPHPLGYPLESGDWSLLDPVRRRAAPDAEG